MVKPTPTIDAKLGLSHAAFALGRDGTGLETIRTRQDRAVALGIDVYIECTVTRLTTVGTAFVGCFGYVVNRALRAAERRLVFWAGEERVAER